MNSSTTLPEEATATVIDRATFELGMQLLAHLLDEAKEHKDQGQLSAHHRGRHVAQTAFAARFLERARTDPGILAGFVSGLSGFLAAWAAGEHVTAEDLRQTTWEDVHGGPTTVYWGEVDPARKPISPVAAGGAAAEEARVEPVEQLEESFAKGTALMAQVIKAVHAGDETHYAEAGWRERGVEQNTRPVREALQVIRDDADIAEGFIVAMTAYIGSMGPRGAGVLNEDYLTTLRHRDCGVGTGAQLIEGGSVKDEHYPSNPAASACSEPKRAADTWRMKVLGLLEDVQDTMGSAVNVEVDNFRNGPFAKDLVYRAQRLLDLHDDALRRGDPDDYYGECIVCVQANLVGARHMPDTSIAFRATLEIACSLLEKIAAILDSASLEPEAPPLPGPEHSTDVATFILKNPELVDNFMEGKGLCSEMVERAIVGNEAGSDEADLEARFRGRGVPQNNFARSFLQEVINRPELLDGFSAALSNTLQVAGTANDSPENMRRLTWEGYVGGPDTEYVAEEDDSTAVATPDLESTFTNPIEIGFDAILRRIDGYLEGLEHVGIGDAAYGALHANAIAHYYSAREQLNQHASIGTVMHHLRQLRDGLNAVTEVMEDDNVGLPLVQACLKPLNLVLRRTSEDVEITPERIKVATAAGSFISRMATVFRDGHCEAKSQDWDALHGAAGVMMSIDDPMDDAPALEARLAMAMECASVIFHDQPPKSWAEGGVVRQEHVGKRLVDAVH